MTMAPNTPVLLRKKFQQLRQTVITHVGMYFKLMAKLNGAKFIDKMFQKASSWFA